VRRHTKASSSGPSTHAHFGLLAAALLAFAFALPAGASAAGAPVVTTGAATNVNFEHAVLVGSVDANEEATTYWFEWGPEDCAGATCLPVPLKECAVEPCTPEPRSLDAGGESSPFRRAAYLGGLDPDTTYHFRIVAENASGVVKGDDETFTTSSAPAPQSCSNEIRREEQHAKFLPDCRAYELASAGESLGNDVVATSSRTHAAATETPSLPAAVTFASLGGFADVHGTGIETEYLSQRDAAAGGPGWSIHAITPPQEPLSLIGGFRGYDPYYAGEMSADLTHGTFRAWSPVPTADGAHPNVADQSNLYLRGDLRQPGAGSYQLLSDAVLPLPPLTASFTPRPAIAAATRDFRHILFETALPLTSDAKGTNTKKLYKWDDGVLRLISPNTCGGEPCSAAGLGASSDHYTDRTLSADGSRVEVTSVNLYQFDDQGTPSGGDDATIQLNASEAASPGQTRSALFETASADGDRVFFTSPEQLTESPGGGLYMWERQDENERQQLMIDASGGSFTLTASAWPSHGSGELESGSEVIHSVEGNFSVGQLIKAPGIPAGTKIEAIPNSNTLTLSAPATASGTEQLDASIQATSEPLPFDASAAQVQAALESLSTIGEGNVHVSGGPGGSSPLDVEFSGALTGVNVLQLGADGSALTGGTSSASVSTTNPVLNLSRIAASESGALGASEDGHRLYFAAAGQEVVGAPPLAESGIYYWQDAEGPPGGTLSFVVGVQGSDLNSLTNRSVNFATPKVVRISPDGRTLAFSASDGSKAGLGYDQTGESQDSNCEGNPTRSGGCAEIYVYRADTSSPLAPDLLCASCDPLGGPATANGYLNMRHGASGTPDTRPPVSRALSADGRYVFFSTEQDLVSRDTNDASDAYMYDIQTETPHLLSSGTDKFGSYFLAASADGHDVYFATRQRLSGWDEDTAYDLYDARVDGGFPEPPATKASCNGEGSCRAPVPAAPAVITPGSESLSGKGNRKPNSCPKGKHAVKKKGKTRCLKQSGRHRKHRAPSHNGGGK
jgi:WD40-like Beta Propeller Repeat